MGSVDSSILPINTGHYHLDQIIKKQSNLNQAAELENWAQNNYVVMREMYFLEVNTLCGSKNICFWCVTHSIF